MIPTLTANIQCRTFNRYLLTLLTCAMISFCAITPSYAQNRMAEIKQRQADFERLQKMRAANPDLPYTIAQSEPMTTSATSAGFAARQVNARMPNNQWTQLAGPEAGPITSLLVKDGRVFAGTLGGIYFSDDEGLTWQRSYGSQAIFSGGLVNLGDAIFYGSDGFGTAQENQGGVWRSIDAGMTWDHLTNGFPENTSIWDLTVWQNTLIARSGSGALYRSTDMGETWTLAMNGFPENLQYAYTASSANTLLAMTNAGLYRAINGGERWEAVNPTLPAGVALSTQHIPFAIGNRFVTNSNNGSVLFSENEGDTWQIGNRGLPADASVLSELPSGEDLFCILANGAVYRSTDRGSSWEKRNDSLAIGKTLRRSVKVGNVNLFATGEGIYRSEDNGATWQNSSTGFRNAYVNGGFITVGKRLYLAAAGGIWSSDTKGASWNLLKNGFRQYPNADIQGTGLAENEGMLFAGNIADGLYRSSDGGANWERLVNGLPEFIDPGVIKVLNHKLYVGAYSGGAFVSTDNGDTWQAVDGLPTDTAIFCFAELGGGRLLAGAYPGGIFRSDDDGQTWWAFQTGLRNDFIDDFTVNGNTVIVGTDDGIYRMNEDESGWSEITYYSENIRGGVNFFARMGKALFASTFGRGIVVSYNNGETWGKYNNGIYTLRGFYFTELSGDLYFGSAGAGVWVLRNQNKAINPF